MTVEQEELRWARVFQAMWLVAERTAQVRGGVYHLALIPGVRDSARLFLTRQGIHAIRTGMLSLRQESPRQAEAIDRLFDLADQKVRWFVEADPSTVLLAGSAALTAGSDLLDALRKLAVGVKARRHLEAMADTYRVIGELEPLSDAEAEEIATLRRQVEEQPQNRELRARLFDRESR